MSCTLCLGRPLERFRARAANAGHGGLVEIAFRIAVVFAEAAQGQGQSQTLGSGVLPIFAVWIAINSLPPP